MSVLFLYGLLLKIVMTAGVVVIASIVVERSGPALGSMIAALPTAGGAAYVILAWEHPASFIKLTTIGGMVANVAVLAFSVVFAAAARRMALLPALGIAYAVWFGAVMLAKLVPWTMPGAIACTIPAFVGGAVISRKIQVAGGGRSVRASAADIAGRAAIVALFVTTVTAFSQALGSFLAGIFALFPVALSAFLVILYRRVGADAAANVAAHMAVPLVGLSLAQLAIHYLADRIGVWWSYVLALTICASWGLAVWSWPRIAGGPNSHAAPALSASARRSPSQP